jgi:hypothetical protein
MIVEAIVSRLIEVDIRHYYITPVLYGAGKAKEQIQMEYFFYQGRFLSVAILSGVIGVKG